MALFDFIEGWYNRHRCHSALGYLSPDDFEHIARRRAATDPTARDEVPNYPRGRLPTPGTRENLPSPVLAHRNNRGENHQPSTRPGQVHYWLGRMTLLANRGAVDDPMVFTMRDRASWLTGVGVLAGFVAAL